MFNDKLRIIIINKSFILFYSLSSIIKDILPFSEIIHLKKIDDFFLNEKYDINVLIFEFQDFNTFKELTKVKNTFGFHMFCFTDFNVLVREKMDYYNFFLNNINAIQPSNCSVNDFRLTFLKIISSREDKNSKRKFEQKLLFSTQDNYEILRILSKTEKKIIFLILYGYNYETISKILNIKLNTISTLKKRALEKLNFKNIIELQAQLKK